MCWEIEMGLMEVVALKEEFGVEAVGLRICGVVGKWKRVGDSYCRV